MRHAEEIVRIINSSFVVTVPNVLRWMPEALASYDGGPTAESENHVYRLGPDIDTDRFEQRFASIEPRWLLENDDGFYA